MMRLVHVLLALGPGVTISLILAGLAHQRSSADVPRTAVPMGLFAVIACAMEVLVPPFLTGIPAGVPRAAADGFLTAALPEEAAKLALLLAVVLRADGVSPRRDAILAGAWLGLGFAILENFFYIASEKDWLLTGLVRAGTAVPQHVALGAIMGWCLTAIPSRVAAVLAAFALPFLLHGTYDFVLQAGRGRVEPAWDLAFAGTLVVTGLLLAGPVASTVRTLPTESDPELADWPTPAWLAGPAAILNLMLGNLVMAGAALGAIFSFSNLGLAMFGILPVAFGAFWLRGRSRRTAVVVLARSPRMMPSP